MVLCQVPEGGPVCASLSPNSDYFSELHTPMGLRNRRGFFRFVGTFPTGGLRAPPPPPRSTNKITFGDSLTLFTLTYVCSHSECL